MIAYTIHYKKTHNRFITVNCIVHNIQSAQTVVQLPVWRPGRYELGNFAKNVQSWKAYNEQGQELAFQKQDHSSWLVETKNVKNLHIQYNYFAADLNAGSTFVDDQQLYVNPVNCLVYVKEKMLEECVLELKVPENYKVAIGLQSISAFQFKAANFDELADSPFIASASLQHDSYTINDIIFHLWFQGECKPDWKKIKNDFQKFTDIQLKTMGGFPVKEYHFLFHILPYRYYHGVEHTTSTVIVLGPSYEIMKKNKLYDELLGISSHELFHTWNIKAIRPLEMFPYDFSTENYSQLGYVAEGVTTYYGDVFLFRSGVFNETDYFDKLNVSLQKHFDNDGRFNYSVAQSSFDTWLDGYTPGIPDRKVSIYTEGCLCAFMTDVLIRQATNNARSLDDVMRILYHEYALQKKGYTEKDYKNLVEKVAGTSFNEFFEKYVYGTHDYEPLLKICLDYLGLELQKSPSKSYVEQYFGLKVTNAKVMAIAVASPAYKAGLLKEDEIIAVNGIKLNGNVNEWCEYFENNLTLTVSRLDQIVKIQMEKDANRYYPIVKLGKQASVSKQQELAYEKWKLSYK